MTALIDKLVQRKIEGRPDLRVIGFKFAFRNQPNPLRSKAKLIIP